MRINLEEIIKEVYDSQDWGMDFDTFKRVAEHPFEELKRTFRTINPDPIRLMYLGTFSLVYRRLKQRFERTLIRIETNKYPRSNDTLILDAKYLFSKLTKEDQDHYEGQLSRTIENYHLREQGSSGVGGG